MGGYTLWHMTDPVTILLHTCCAPCATTGTERLLASGYRPVLFFSNSNIFPEEEYAKRLRYAVMLARILGLELIEDAYDHRSWLKAVAGLEDEPEGGLRCTRCFQFNLARTAGEGAELGIPGFTTTLSVSRYKSSAQIFEAGSRFTGFLPMDFKKGNGYARSIELSSAYDLYRQNYCGCEFSLRKRG